MMRQIQAQRAPSANASLGPENLDGLFDGIVPWKGEVKKGRQRSCIGALHPIKPWDRDKVFPDETEYQETGLPRINWGEAYFEWVSMFMAVRAARRSFTMVSLGAHFGGPLVDSALALQKLNPMPCFLVGVEADPHMCAMLDEHFRENGIDPNDHWIINCAVNDTNRPVVFPVSEMRTGANSVLRTSEERETLFDMINNAGKAPETLRNVLIEGSTQLYIPLANMEGTPEARGELRFVSAVTVADVLGPLPFVDYLEIDMQLAEEWTLPPARELLKRRVRLLHLGTHGGGLHRDMAAMFAADGWEVLVDLMPQTQFDTPEGPFTTGDGVLIAHNPALDNSGR